MTNSANIAVFGGFNASDGVYTDLLGMRIGVPDRKAEEFGGPGVDIAALGPVDTSAHVEAWFRIGFRQTSVDTATAHVDLLRAELRDLSPITVGLKGSAYTGTLTPTIAKCIEVPVDSKLIQTYATIIEVVVRREPWVYGPVSALYSASALSLPAVLDLSAMTGDAAAPLNLLFDATTANLHQLVCGVYPEAPVALTKFIHKAVDLSWDVGSAAADANGWPDGAGNTLWKTNSAAGASANVDVTDYLGGSYAVYANVKRDAGCSPATIETSVTDPVAIEGTDLRRQLLGIVSLPVTTVRGAAQSSLGIVLTGDGTDYAYCGTIEVIPASWGYVGWHHSSAGLSADTLRFSGGLVYADDRASLAYRIGDSELLAKGGTLVVTGEATTEAPTLAATLGADYDPRWEQLPSAGDLGAGPGI